MYNQSETMYDTIQPVESEYECIQRYNHEIKNSTVLLNKLSKLLWEEKLTIDSFTNIALKYTGKLDNSFKLRDLYQEIILDERRVVDQKFDSAVEAKELLNTRKKINDIDDDEFNVKIRAVEWELSSQKDKKQQLGEGVRLLNGLGGMLHPESVSEIKVILEDDLILFCESGVDEQVIDRLASSLRKILDFVNDLS
jgi:hypothetical protein